MKTKPILFSTEMVQVNLAGRKTNTRRVIDEKHFGFLEYAFKNKKNLADWISRTAKYQIGDVLWVRETFIDVNQQAEKHFSGVRFHYKADGEFVGCWPWKPSIHMPKEAARIFLKILNVRVERLQDISEEDCVAEGIKMIKKGDVYQDIEDGKLIDKIHDEDCFYFYPSKGDFRDDSYMPKSIFPNAPKTSFYSLWEKINGEGSWNKNPFVWVYEYQIIEKPENFLS